MPAATNSRSTKGRPVRQIGSDGGLLDAPVEHKTLVIAPAERFDVIVDFSQYQPGDEVTLVNKLDNNANVLRFKVARKAADDSRSRPNSRRTPYSQAQRHRPAEVAVPPGRRGRAQGVDDQREAVRPGGDAGAGEARSVRDLVVHHRRPPPGARPPRAFQVLNRGGGKPGGTTRAGRTPSTSGRPRSSTSWSNSPPTRASTSSTATTSNTKTWP